MNPLRELRDAGQSVWLDYIRRDLLESGELDRLIAEDGLSGMTSNPSIFQKAIAGSTDYSEALAAAASDRQLDAKDLFERLAIDDIRRAADALAGVHRETRGADGHVSLEVSPRLAHDTEATVAEAKRLWSRLERPNVMIKVPATPAGIPAIRALIAAGININVTLLFSVDVYVRVVEAYIQGLEDRAAQDQPIDHLASVASFFVSRVDSAIDHWIDERLAGGEPAAADLAGLRGKAAIANAKLAYRRSSELFSGERWSVLEQKGARAQRLLWASTSTKDPSYSDVLYVESLIGPNTVNTIPPATYDAFRDHGRVEETLAADVAGAERVLAELAAHGLDLARVTDELLVAGVSSFAKSFEQLLSAVEESCAARSGDVIGRQTRHLPAALEERVAARLEAWHSERAVRRLWRRDASLWTGADEASWLGWLHITADQLGDLESMQAFRERVRKDDFKDAVVLGMGGSSLCPEVLALTFGAIEGWPRLHVLDSTDPAQVRALEARLDLARTLFIVSSKSGSTLEPNIFLDYFLERIRSVSGGEQAGQQFVAVTDPGSKLEARAAELGFRHIFHGVPSIGGRYSALSNFGLVPAAAMGLDVAELLERAEEMVHACAACVPTEVNPGALLGVILGEAGRSGRDKLSLVVSPGIADLGAWLEQLVAESTGKRGIALIPVDGERLGAPELYGADRLFVYLRLETAPDAGQDVAVAALEAAGQPIVRLALRDAMDLGQELFRWEFATAVAGAVLEINPFDQPDVEASKIATRALTEAFESSGALPAEAPFLTAGDLAFYADDANVAALAAGGSDLGSVLAAHLDRIRPGDYFAVLAYIEMCAAHDGLLQRLRLAVRDHKRVATSLGYGPRFLHSTGQAYKGGPASGVFLQLTCDDSDDLDVPGRAYSFGIVKAAQARGDFTVLAERGRRALRVHLGREVSRGLEQVVEAVEHALTARV